MLYQLGTVQFEVAPFNLDQYDRDTGADFASKDTMGNVRPREFMGEADEAISIVGRLYPEKFGGLDTMDELHRLRTSGTSQILVRGDGRKMGWFFIERLRERHKFLDVEGIGKQIDFEVSLIKAPKPSASSYITTLLRLFSS